MDSSGPLAGIDAIADVYGLGPVYACGYLPNGFLNRNWRVESEAGVFALKELANTSAEEARRSLALMASVAADGVPVVEAVAVGGEAVVEVGGGAYYLAPWIEGDHRRGAEMTPETSFHMGEVLGRVRLALGRPGLLPEGEPRAEAPPSVGTAHERIADYLGIIGGRSELDEFDLAAEPLLRSRIGLIDACAHLRPSGALVGPVGWTHGDCQNWNLIWQGDRIAAVLDWDRVRVNPYGEEVVRAATYQCALADGSLDLECVAAIVAGYRSVVPIGAEALVDAVRRRWWKLLTSVWHLKYHYYQGDRSSDWIFFSDERLLRWWTANLDKVESVFGA
ncbi:phosphotransferase [Glycomyces dulcitolivorans]|uniref:phosphotransferase n=1 Tax=Glycomyces dulcitolivorans TaxID=2200759 RepID=UPI000DD4463A|nr:phosphotransferase [Glycomyces dulcitolivorans]